MTVGEIIDAIPQPARARVLTLLKQHYPDYGGKINGLLLAEFRLLKNELAAVSLLPDYAAYAVPYFVYTQVQDVNEIDRLGENPARN